MSIPFQCFPDRTMRSFQWRQLVYIPLWAKWKLVNENVITANAFNSLITTGSSMYNIHLPAPCMPVHFSYCLLWGNCVVLSLQMLAEVLAFQGRVLISLAKFDLKETFCQVVRSQSLGSSWCLGVTPCISTGAIKYKTPQAVVLSVHISY